MKAASEQPATGGVKCDPGRAPVEDIDGTIVANIPNGNGAVGAAGGEPIDAAHGQKSPLRMESQRLNSAGIGSFGNY